MWKIYKWNGQSVYEIIQEEYDIAINLDKDIEACMLLNDVAAKNKFGFTCSNYHIDIATKNAQHKLTAQPHSLSCNAHDTREHLQRARLHNALTQ